MEPNSELLQRLLAYHHLSEPSEFYLMLADDEINLSPASLKEVTKERRSLMSKLLRNPFASRKKNADAAPRVPINRREVYTLHPESDPPNYRVVDCCQPIPGDDVLGFVDDDEQVVLHRVDCPRAQRLKSSYGSRLVSTRWASASDRFLVTIKVEGIDRLSILEDIIHQICSVMKINLRALTVATKVDIFHCELQVQVDGTETVAALCSELKKIQGVKFARRIS